MTNPEELERTVLDEYEPRWIEQGYRVIRQPQRGEIPEFLGHFRPDALVVGQQPNLVVEIVRKGAPHAEEKIRRLKALLGDRKDWRLEVLYSGDVEKGVQPSTSQAISELLNAARRLHVHEPQAALLLTWAALEAVTRRLEPAATWRPQSPGRVVELLASAGHIAPSEAEQLRAAVSVRNRLIHGDLSVRPAPVDVSLLIDVAHQLLGELLRRERSTT